MSLRGDYAAPMPDATFLQVCCAEAADLHSNSMVLAHLGRQPPTTTTLLMRYEGIGVIGLHEPGQRNKQWSKAWPKGHATD